MNVAAPDHFRLHVLLHQITPFPQGYSRLLLIDFQFVNTIAITALFGAKDTHITGRATAEGEGVGTTISASHINNPGPAVVVGRDLDFVFLSILTAMPLDDDFADGLALAEIDLEPFVVAAPLIPVAAAVTINGIGCTVATAVITRGASGFIQRQVVKTAGVATILSRRREARHHIILAVVSDGVHIEVQTWILPLIMPALVACLITVGVDVFQESALLVFAVVGELRPEDGEAALTGLLAVIGGPAVADRLRGFGMERSGVVTSSTGCIVLDRATLVMLVRAMTFATGGLGRSIHSGTCVTVKTIASLREAGTVVRGVAVHMTGGAVPASSEGLAGGNADQGPAGGIMTAGTSVMVQRISRINQRRRIAMAGTTAGPGDRHQRVMRRCDRVDDTPDSTVTAGTVA